jgi:hypothetical protein
LGFGFWLSGFGLWLLSFELGLGSHSHRGFSPVLRMRIKVPNGFTGFSGVEIREREKPLKRLGSRVVNEITGLKPR